MIRKSLLLLSIALCTLPAFAADPAPVKPGLFEGPNMALALVAIVQLIAIMAIAGILRRLTQNTDFFVKLLKMRDAAKNGGPLLIFGFVFYSLDASAATGDMPKFPEFFRNENTMLLLGLNLVLLIVFIYLTGLLRKTIATLMPEIEQKPEVELAATAAQSSIMAALTDAVPIEREHEILLDHEYDGITELDNNLPPWWVWMFYVTIIIGVVYMAWYHILPYGQNQHEQYIAELEQAEVDRQAFIALMGESVDENTVTFLEGAEDLKAGKAIYVANCQACHAADGGGGVGPNFTDNYWLHGGAINDIFKVIKHGVPQKGMIAWESQLRPKEIAQVASFIKTLVGTTPASPKEPQGELYSGAPVPENVPAEGAIDSTVVDSAAVPMESASALVP
jgi:cytochrome c oxidase cbb3-type subunit 3